MFHFPWASSLAAAAVVLSCGCRGGDASRESTAGLPFVRRAAIDSFAMTSTGGDTLRFRSHQVDNDRVRLVRYRRSEAGLDSVSATVDVRTLAPLASHHHQQTGAGPLTADLAYGAGFEGQARLTRTSAAGEWVDNLRTPPPYLDAAQLPQSVAALDLAEPDTITFNYIAPFEARALTARLVVGELATIDLPDGPTAAYPLHLRVSGLEERFWVSPDGHRLLRWREVTRGMTWTRIGPVAP